MDSNPLYILFSRVVSNLLYFPLSKVMSNPLNFFFHQDWNKRWAIHYIHYFPMDSFSQNLKKNVGNEFSQFFFNCFWPYFRLCKVVSNPLYFQLSKVGSNPLYFLFSKVRNNPLFPFFRKMLSNSVFFLFCNIMSNPFTFPVL